MSLPLPNLKKAFSQSQPQPESSKDPAAQPSTQQFFILSKQNKQLQKIIQVQCQQLTILQKSLQERELQCENLRRENQQMAVRCQEFRAVEDKVALVKEALMKDFIKLKNKVVEYEDAKLRLEGRNVLLQNELGERDRAHIGLMNQYEQSKRKSQKLQQHLYMSKKENQQLRNQIRELKMSNIEDRLEILGEVYRDHQNICNINLSLNKNTNLSSNKKLKNSNNMNSSSKNRKNKKLIRNSIYVTNFDPTTNLNAKRNSLTSAMPITENTPAFIPQKSKTSKQKPAYYTNTTYETNTQMVNSTLYHIPKNFTNSGKKTIKRGNNNGDSNNVSHVGGYGYGEQGSVEALVNGFATNTYLNSIANSVSCPYAV